MPSWLPNTVDHGMPLQRRRGILTPRSHRTGMTRSTFLALRTRSQRVMMTAWFNSTAAWFNSTVASGGAGGGRWWRRMAPWRSFRDSLKVLVADIEHSNALASEYWRDYDRACLQMRMSYSPAVRIFLFLMQWTNCSLADAVGLLRILLFLWTAPPPCPPMKGMDR